MILRHASVFAQLLDLIPRAQFDALVRRHGAEDRTKGFSSWDQFVAMLFCQLGRGGMGVVYKARQTGLNRVVALKMILSAEHAGTDEMKRFRIEAEAVAQLKHPGIVQVYEIGDHKGLPYFSMEFVEGGSLSGRIKGKPQPPRWSAQIAEKLALAMHAAHAEGIVHRDLKPANVLLTPGDEPKIMDFGLAKRLRADESLTVSGAVMGTPQYMAPEQASGEAKHVGPLADVYALGAILYETLTGKPPFSADTALGVLRKVLSEEPALPSRIQRRIPPDLETICLKCLQKEPQKRYGSASELADDLRRYLNGEPIVARASSLWEKAAKRRPASAALIIGGVWYNAQVVAERNNAVAEAKRARAAEERQRLEAERARLAEAQATRRLADSLVLQADALCLAGRPRESLERYNDARRTLTSLGEPTFAVETGIFELCSEYPPPLHTFTQVAGKRRNLN